MRLALLLAIAGGLGASAHAQMPQAARIHSVTDLSHEFTFYADGRFATQYLDPAAGDVDVRNWGTLSKFDLTNANLLVLMSGASPCAYTEADLAHVQAFLESGGGVVALGSYALFPGQADYGLNAVAGAFGARFAEQQAEAPLRAQWPGATAADEVRTYGGSYLTLNDPAEWMVLVVDAKGHPVLAGRRVGKGALLLASRGLAGQQPDASDPINADVWKPGLRFLAAGKPVTAGQTPPDVWCGVDNSFDKEGLRVGCSDYLVPYADSIYEVYSQVKPTMERIVGVPPSEGMLGQLVLLPSGGGGFSAGATIGIAVWWGDFPAKRYGMVELLSHESMHSWVLPFPEPLWNEGIATYVGILVGRELGLEEDADATLAGWIAGARQADPDMDKLDIAHGQGIPHSVAMAKPMWIWEQLRAEKPDIMALYFQAKRKLITAERKEYTADDSVAVLSIAIGRDLFPWFQSLGVTVDRGKTDLPTP